MSFKRRTVLSVKALVSGARRRLEAEYGDVSVRGEISSITRAASGHYYLTLADDEAQIRAVFFRQYARFLAFNPTEGLEVVANGRLSVYEPRGDMQLIVDKLEPVGEGALAAAFERLKRELAAQGYFDADRKVPIPEQARTIGVVTSLAAAALFDTLRTLFKRQPGLHVIVSPTPVQGADAPPQIADALAAIDRVGCDVILLVRGGGSPEDLWAFNDEHVVKAIAACVTPVISGVGHEIDFTLADFTADLRAATPTAAAQAAVSDSREDRAMLRHFVARLTQAMERRLLDESQYLDDLVFQRDRAVLRRLREQKARTSELTKRLHRAQPARRTRRQRTELENLRGRMARAVATNVSRTAIHHEDLRRRLYLAIERQLTTHRRLHDARRRELEALSPVAVLARGYAIVRDPVTGRAVRRASDATVGSRLGIRLHAGSLEAKVEKVNDESAGES
ncbi:MAG: exodeoxyribonuclease VII large subunit [Deltaproteobacteria bacterium]|nr:exodeoxyribonuclease VII large subunit [Deltaproteobacteria bacterium]